MIMTAIYVMLLFWSGWCVASKQVKDGVVGRLAYAAVAIAAFAAIFGKHPATAPASNVVIIFAVALIGARHFTIKMLNAWLASRKHP